MWKVSLTPTSDSLLTGSAARNGAPVGQIEFIRSWQSDQDARARILDALSGVPFPAFRWECPPLRAGTERSFEFVVAADRSLSRSPDFAPFAPQLSHARTPVVSFPSLGRDAHLVVPAPTNPRLDFAHLAAFLRNAPVSIQHALLAEVSRQVVARHSAEPLWLSTAGGGVAWLHVRLDSTPKYYSHQPYRQPA
jgi:hypothetical protein